MHSITQGFPFEVMFLQLKQAVKGRSVMTRRCKSAIVKDRNKNLLGWMICNRVNNLWWKIWLFTWEVSRNRSTKQENRLLSCSPKADSICTAENRTRRCFLEKMRRAHWELLSKMCVVASHFLGGGGSGSAFSCINSASDTNSLLCKIQHANSESKTL